MLPPPADDDFEAPMLSDQDFLNTDAPEDELLLKTGAWDDVPNDPETPEGEDEPTGTTTDATFKL